MNVGLAGGLSFSFVLSWFYCVWAWLCFLVFEGFSMFHVKHDVFTTKLIQLLGKHGSVGGW